MNKYIAEFLGTFALVFFGTGAIVVNELHGGVITHPGVAIVFGLVIMAMIYSLGDISGAHLNPAVTIAFAFAKRFKTRQVLPYIISQLTGAFFASIILQFLFPASNHFGATLPAGSAAQSFILEFILTFFLMLVIINVATGSKEKGMFAGLAIGATVLFEAMFAGPISGASMNPARSLSPAIISQHNTDIWIYLTAPIMGALLSIPVNNLIHKKTKNENSTFQ